MLHLILHCQTINYNQMLLCRFLEKFPLFPDVQQQEVKLDEVAASLGQLLLLCILFTALFFVILCN